MTEDEVSHDLMDFDLLMDIRDHHFDVPIDNAHTDNFKKWLMLQLQRFTRFRIISFSFLSKEWRSTCSSNVIRLD